MTAKAVKELRAELEAKAAEGIATYSVGDYVWCYPSTRESASHALGRVAEAHPSKDKDGHTWWMVLLYVGTGAFWSRLTVARRVARALNPSEVHRYKSAGVISRREPALQLPLPGERR